MSPHFFTAPFYFAFIWFRVQGSGGGFAATIPMTIHAALFLPPSFGRRCPEGAEVGPVKRYSHIRGSQPRLASLVCPFQRKGREIFVIRSQGLAPPHMPRCSAFLICLSCRLCPIRPCGAPSPRGEGCDTRIPSSKKGGTPPL